jgi:hypothetical protein
VAGLTTSGIRQLVHNLEPRVFDALDHQLGDPVATLDADRFRRVVIDHDHLDLAAVTGVDRARCIDQSETCPDRQPGPRVNETRVSVRDGECDPGGQQRSLPRLQYDAGGRHQVGTGISVQRVTRYRHIGIEAPQSDRHGSSRHRAKGYPRAVIESPPVTTGTVHYSEQLRTPWWWYPMAVAVAVLLGFEFSLAVRGWIAWIPLVILVPMCVLVVWRFSSGRVRLVGSALTAGDRQLELSRVDRAIGLSTTELRRLVGRHSDPAAFVFIRSWVGPGVQLVLAPANGNSEPSAAIHDRSEGNPEDSGSAPRDHHPREVVPYWVVSTRHPDRLLGALAAQSVPVG